MRSGLATTQKPGSGSSSGCTRVWSSRRRSSTLLTRLWRETFPDPCGERCSKIRTRSSARYARRRSIAEEQIVTVAPSAHQGAPDAELREQLDPLDHAEPLLRSA